MPPKKAKAAAPSEHDIEPEIVEPAPSKPEDEAEAEPVYNPNIKAFVQQTDSSKPVPRLMIKNMFLTNFKSYAGRKEVGPFHKCFSSIVGPNGSGKSNVIDALLFVFGKRATQIRLKKLSELIHNSAAHRNLPHCTVEVQFHLILDTDDHDGYSVLPNSEFTISRTADRDSKAYYKIDGKKVQFREVQDKLGEHGVDLNNNRFLILQGEVESIAMMKPKAQQKGSTDGLLEYLEDIIGTNRYVEAIEKAWGMVENLNEQRQSHLNRVKVTEKEKEALEPAKNEAEEYLKKDQELNKKKADLSQAMAREAQVIADDIEAKKVELKGKLEKERERSADALKKVEALQETFNTKTQEADVIEAQMAKAKTSFDAFERKDIQMREAIKNEQTKVKKGTSKVAKCEETISTHQEKMESDAKELPGLEAQVPKLTTKKEELDQQFEKAFQEVKSKIEPIKVEREKKETEMMPLKKEVNACQQQIDITQSEIKIYDQKLVDANAKFEEAKKSLAEGTTEVEQKSAELEDKRKVNAGQKKKFASITSELKELTQAEVQAGEELNHKVKEHASAKHALESESGKNALQKALMKEKKKSLPGVQGRLGELGKIDKKYDCAITSSCPGLNNIVVDNTATGNQCIAFLKRNKLGVATFILMDHLEDAAKMMDEKKSTPEGVPRLFDLIQVKNPDYRPAFYSALRDTLVAENIDQALRVRSAGNWKVVTLAGEVMDTTGTMAGGGKPQTGGMSSTITGGMTDEEVKALEQAVHEAQSKLNAIRDRKRAAEAEMQDLSKALQESDGLVNRLNMTVEHLSNQQRTLQARMPQLEAALKLSSEDKKAVANWKSKLAEYESAKEAAEAKTQKLQAAIDKLEQAMLDAGGARMRDLKAEADRVSAKLDETQTRITKIKVDNNASAKKIKKAEADRTEHLADIETAKKRVSDLEGEMKAMEADAEKVVMAFKEAEAKLIECKRELAALQNEYETVKKVVDKIRAVELEVANQMEDYDRAIKDNKNKYKHWMKKLADLVRKIRKAGRSMEQDAKIDESEEKSDVKESKESKADQDAKMDTSSDDSSNAAASAQVADNDDDVKQGQDKQNDKYFVYLTEEEVKAIKKDDLQYKITMLEEGLAHMKPNMRAIADYRRKEQEYLKRVEALDEITKKRDETRKAYDALRKKRLDEFMAGFSVISMKLKEMYQMLTLGGDAELELVDTLDPFSEGILFSVRPPKKSWKHIQNLSGGEKTLSSLALVFALHHYKPTPLYVMDEIDAALDFKNVSIVANYIKERTKNAQFIIISLRNNMFELADRLVGIYKTENQTKSITIDPRKFAVPTQGQVQENKQQAPVSSKTKSESMDVKDDKKQVSSPAPLGARSQNQNAAKSSPATSSTVPNKGQDSPFVPKLATQHDGPKMRAGLGLI